MVPSVQPRAAVLFMPSRSVNVGVFLFFFLLLPRPPRSPLFPYTTLFRSKFFGQCAVSTTLTLCERSSASRTASGATDNGRSAVTSESTSTLPLPISSTAVMNSGPKRRSEEHTSELQSLRHLVCRLLLEKK